MRLILATFVALISFAVTASPLAAALIVNGYDTEPAGSYDRFANHDNAPFIGSAYDWSGVGRTSGGFWGVLISPSFVLSSRHYAPSNGEQIRFYKTNDPTGEYLEKSIVSSTVMADSDLILTQLGEATTGVATYAIRNPAANLIGEELYVWGQADTPNYTRLGRNEVSGIWPNFSDPLLVGQGDVIVYDYDTSATGLGPDEAMLASGDSGGPSFIIGPDGPELVGIHWFIYEAKLPDLPFPGSGDTLVTSYINQMNSVMAASGQSVTVAAVPEPGALGLVLAGFSIVFIRRRQRAA